jgi:para-nitrobenzyl esterase
MKIPKRLKAVALVAAVASLSAPDVSGASGSASLTVPTEHGTVTGVARENMEAWLGIPYAAPPVGPLRWKPPQPAPRRTSPLLAQTPSAGCAQNQDLGVFAKAGGSEDCLFLNVYRPAGSAGDRKAHPVFVWIHGGALRVGRGEDYDPHKLVAAGAVVVTINYRLGVFGFFAHPDLAVGRRVTANFGLLDQQAALGWVQRNIAAFGGDPRRVTIAGESSGGASVIFHVISQGSSGLFERAIAMSGSAVMIRHPAFGAPVPLSVSLQRGLDFAKDTGCTGKGAHCLRALTTQQVLAAQSPYVTNQILLDDTVVPVHPADLIAAGKVNPVTLINGNTRAEGTFFVALEEIGRGRNLAEGSYSQALNAYYGTALGPKVAVEYPVFAFSSPSAAYAATMTDSLFACPGLRLDRLLSNRLPLYAYEFSDDTAPSYTAPTSFPLGAGHTLELSYVFPGFSGANPVKPVLNGLQEGLSAEMIRLFLGDPARSGWEAFSPSREQVMTFRLPASEQVSGRFAQFHHCDFWNQSGTF